MKSMKDSIAKKSKIIRAFIFAVFYILIFLIAFIGLTPTGVSYSVGDIANESVIAPKRIINERMTENLRNQAENTTAPVYDYIATAQENAQNSLDGFFGGVSGMYMEYLDSKAVEAANSVYSQDLSIDDYKYLLGLSSAEMGILHSAARDALDNVYLNNEVISSNMDEYKAFADNFIQNTALNKTQKQIVAQVVKNYIYPNMLLNESATKIAKQAARDSVYEVVYEAGQTIINKGDVITEDDIRLLKDNGLIKTGLFDKSFSTIGLPALLLLVTVLFLGFVKQYYPNIYYSTKKMTVIGITCIVALLISQISIRFSIYLLPAALFSMTMCLMFGAKAAMLFNFFFVVFISIATQLDSDSVIFLTVSSYAGIIKLRSIRSRFDIFKSGALVCAINALVVILIGVARNNVFSFYMLKNITYCIGSGLISTLVTNALNLLWETVFGMLTPFKLLEMSGANDDAIQRLVNVAPGTYHHSLIVSNLAESAAAAINANPLLARVGAYYHDIGKSEKPLYFSENQANTENFLENLPAEASAKIIKNHVTDGVYIAQKYNIPKEIIEFIITHHGTSEITYFKVKAQSEGYKGEENFHYSGKLPESKETGIVMFADSVEAAVRSLSNPNAENIRNIIDSVVNKKINEGQLLKSHLTFKDIETIKQEFWEVLCNVYHERVKYPGQEEKE